VYMFVGETKMDGIIAIKRGLVLIMISTTHIPTGFSLLL
jgi:hypothetical protein